MLKGQFVVALAHLVPALVETLADLTEPGVGNRWGPREVRDYAAASLRNCDACRAAAPQAPSIVTGGPGRGSLYVVLATNGTEVATCLGKACRPVGEGRLRHVIKLEDHLPLKDYLAPLGYHDDAPDLPAMFHLPTHVMEAAWRAALSSVAEEAAPLIAAGGDVFLTFHAVLRDTKERNARMYVSAVDPLALRAMIATLDVSDLRLMVLIDDAFAVAARLTVEGKMYYGMPAPTVLLDLVSWRRHEVLAADLIARVLEVPRLIVPVNIPLTTFEKILTRPPDEMVHLSYEVSEPFRLEPEETDARLAFVTTVAEGLREISSVTLIECTAVDDYRLVFGEGKARPVPRPRWPVPQEPLLAAPVDSDNVTLMENGCARASAHEVRRLRGALLESVHVRGRALAAQAAGGVVLLRPFSRRDGEASEGMRIVAQLNEALRISGHEPSRRPTFIYHPDSDERRRVAYLLVRTLSGVLETRPKPTEVDALVAFLACDPDLGSKMQRAVRSPANIGAGRALLDLLEAGAGARPFRARGDSPELTERFGAAMRNALAGGSSQPTAKTSFGAARWLGVPDTTAAEVVRLVKDWLGDVSGSGSRSANGLRTEPAKEL